MLKILALLLAQAAAFAGAGTPYLEKGCFTVVFPEGWAQQEQAFGLGEAERRVYGADFAAPGAGLIPVRISVKYYAPGNLLHKTHEQYIRRHAKPPLGANLDGKIYGKVSDGKAGDYYAKVFERKTFDYFPKRAVNTKKYPVYEKFHVVPVKQGYYVLRYTAPLEKAKEAARHYEAAVASFKPLIR